jgi:hypothetical protein
MWNLMRLASTLIEVDMDMEQRLMWAREGGPRPPCYHVA